MHPGLTCSIDHCCYHFIFLLSFAAYLISECTMSSHAIFLFNYLVDIHKNFLLTVDFPISSWAFWDRGQGPINKILVRGSSVLSPISGLPWRTHAMWKVKEHKVRAVNWVLTPPLSISDNSLQSLISDLKEHWT